MKKRGPSLIVGGQPFRDWDPDSKEPWHVHFEKEEVNDERWTCIVTAAIPFEAYDEECIQVFSQCAATGLRKAMKIIKMKDVVNLLKNGDVKKDKNNDDKKRNKTEESVGQALVDLAASRAVFADSDCKLPPDLMAAVLKLLILTAKRESVLQKKREQAKKDIRRQEKLKANFIRSKRPYEVRTEEEEAEEEKVPPNPMGMDEYVDDAPVGGPDLYIMLTEFYNPFYFSELVRINVPFVALIKVTGYGDEGMLSHSSIYGKVDFIKQSHSITDFWENLRLSCLIPEETAKFQHIAMMQYQPPTLKVSENKKYDYGIIFDQLTWMQYSAYCIYRQHQSYLQELYVQKTVMSLETLDLSRCEVYNKLCDALITGEPNTFALVLHALIEQVVAGVPETESVKVDYAPVGFDFSNPTMSTFEFSKIEIPVKFSTATFHDSCPPCKYCKTKRCQHGKPCSNWEISTSEKDEWCGEERTAGNSSEYTSKEKSLPSAYLDESRMSEALICQVLREKITEKEIRSNKKWKSPKLYFYGDEFSLSTYHCDPRLIDSTSVVDRFWKHAGITRMWKEYPVLPPEKRAFYNFHFQLLLKMSRETPEDLKVRMCLALCMKLIGMTYGFLYIGEKEDESSIFVPLREKIKKLSKVRFGSNAQVQRDRVISKNFSDYFFKTFIEELDFRSPRKTIIKMDNVERHKGSIARGESINLRKFTGHFDVHIVARRDSGMSSFLCVKSVDSDDSHSLGLQINNAIDTLNSLLDCSEISAVTECNLFQEKDDYSTLIQNFYFFEKLEPRRMVQRLLEAQETYNTTHCVHFPPSDTLIVVTYNDFDHRGIFYSSGVGVLPTPVTLRDFYHYVYPEISDWLIREEEEHAKITTKIQKKEKEIEDKKDIRYLTKLKKKFCQMSEEERNKFLESKQNFTQPETEIPEKELENLRKKPKFGHYNVQPSFIVSNFTNLRVEVNTKVQEYFSRDGTKVKVTTESWLYNPAKLIRLEARHSALTFTYNKWLGFPENDATFTLKSDSGIIFVFYKNDPEIPLDVTDSEIKKDFNYFINISWPTGLLIRGIPCETSSVYVKQSYIKVYRKGWDIEEEKSRCYLKNGQILIFKETGGVEVLSASGEKLVLHEFGKSEKVGAGDRKSVSPFLPAWMSKCEWTATTGEVWEKMNKDSSNNQKKLLKTHKIYIGVDPKAQEIYYKREDGVTCMLWSNGKLVTSFPDGTKISSVPEFDEEEIAPEWTEEEKLMFSKKETKFREDQIVKSRAILRKPGSHMSQQVKEIPNPFQSQTFVSVSCTYLMEHPKYSTVYFDPKNSFALVKLPGELSVKIDARGNHEVMQGRKGLLVQDSLVEFYKKCEKCEEKSAGTLNPESTKIIYKFIDFDRKVFLVNSNGESWLRDSTSEDCGVEKFTVERRSTDKACYAHKKFKPVKAKFENQRCFALERDLGGHEFLSLDALAAQNHHLPDETHFDLNVQPLEDSVITHTFSSPHSKVGFENWTMNYEDAENSLPTNLKKYDLKEIGLKDCPKKLFKFTHNECQRRTKSGERQKFNAQIDMPKVIVTRIVKCFPHPPKNMTDELEKLVKSYQKRAQDICNHYTKHKIDDHHRDSYLKMKKKKKLSVLNTKLSMYSYLGTQVFSTDREIHRVGHFLNLMETFKSYIPRDSEFPLDCKQMPRTLPRFSNFKPINEENENFSDSAE